MAHESLAMEILENGQASVDHQRCQQKCAAGQLKYAINGAPESIKVDVPYKRNDLL